MSFLLVQTSPGCSLGEFHDVLVGGGWNTPTYSRYPLIGNYNIPDAVANCAISFLASSFELTVDCEEGCVNGNRRHELGHHIRSAPCLLQIMAECCRVFHLSHLQFIVGRRDRISYGIQTLHCAFRFENRKFKWCEMCTYLSVVD